MSVKVIKAVKELPEYSRETADVIPLVENWLEGQEERFRRKIIKIFEGAGVDKRYSIMSPEEVFTSTSFEEKNNIYVREVKKMGKNVLQNALTATQWQPESLDYIITVSCTGIMIPSLDAYLINELQLKQDITRLPVTEMGCAAGISGMIYAHNFLKANPGKRAAVIAVESPTATFQLEDFSMANMVSAAIFGDGAACVLLSSEEEAQGPEILAEEMYHFYDATHLMGFGLTNAGLQMILDPAVPETISSRFEDIIFPFLEKNNSSIEKVNHLIFHPGGKKIVQTVSDLFGNLGKNIDDTREVLRLYGNMSSATVLYVLQRFLEKDIPEGEQGIMLSFGPGFSAQRILLQW
ncbi:3-oxoacyl-[acyl-carrier-protein] synthase III C-terminal domain-containing protein [Zunongwangia sp. F363]|uniref:3-oxoacyl-[acyl-carrier-protein] synthase III C-terminal domain-containing protein n=1 Tax=Autumnicola tepida TaxID=3075595 RepID=A0ABU3C669_9FLAO|nr:3-oxoacyl-[acyl-carrier-protein] synthase III C-terminal domain-containing protein [Zunongwangia sp. F363]MDT0641836.1 3-oxoacyl-[acyl-carrier-protein] synthase III C-terminal domain-containing protein [Zunongwangia sp. F363]